MSKSLSVSTELSPLRKEINALDEYILSSLADHQENPAAIHRIIEHVRETIRKMAQQHGISTPFETQSPQDEHPTGEEMMTALQVIDFIGQRLNVAGQVGRIKKNFGAEVYDPQREAIILQKITNEAIQFNLPEKKIIHLFQDIITLCRGRQQMENGKS